MPAHADATFEVKQWDEKAYHEEAGSLKLTRAHVRKVFQGDLEGESSVEYLMAYPAQAVATFVGLEHVTGQLAGRAGGFVLEHSGTDDGNTTSAAWSVVTGSGTGQLKGLQGKGGASLSRGEKEFRFSLDYEFGG